jgi:hypothetical protein
MRKLRKEAKFSLWICYKVFKRDTIFSQFKLDTIYLILPDSKFSNAAFLIINTLITLRYLCLCTLCAPIEF